MVVVFSLDMALSGQIVTGRLHREEIEVNAHFAEGKGFSVQTFSAAPPRL